MENFYFLKILNSRIFSNLLLFLCFISSVKGQNYPPEVLLSDIEYQDYQLPTGGLPEYLEPITESLSGSNITRISDRDVFGTTSQRLRHNYALDQTWNSDGTLIKLAGYPAAILDAETFEFLYWSNIPSYGRWSNTQPHIIYGTSVDKFVAHDVNTNSRTTLRTFSEYQRVDFGFGKSTQDNNDRYVGLIGILGNGDRVLIVYDILNDNIVGTKNVGSQGDLAWFSVSQLGQYAVISWRNDGTGATQGIKSYNLDFTNEQHLYNTTEHGDLGVDQNGNEVFVSYGGQSQWDADYSLFMVRLDGGGVTNLFPYVNNRGIWGGHISCRNVNRPGWAYVSEQCCTTNPVAPREIFAIKLDDSGTIERYAKHHNDVSPGGLGHSAQAVPNRNGTKILFASNWNDSSIMNDPNPPAYVLEYPQGNVGMTVNAGNDRQICNGNTITLTATGTGGTNYAWSTGQTSQSITVSPNATETYTVTLSDNSGNSVSDDVTVTVNPVPIANAGTDITINEGESVNLTAVGGSSFLWSTGEMSQSITVSPTETTTYSVTVSDNGCTSEPDEVTVTVIPTPIEADAGADVAICFGESTILTASGGSDYVWSTGETSQSITVNPQTTTTYTVTVSEGNVSDSDSVIVTVNPIPSANAGDDVTINEGESTTLTASGGTSFSWNTGETTQSITVNPTETTTYSVTVSDNGCTSQADSVIVTVIPNNTTVIADAGEDVTICQYDYVTLTATGGTDYVWSTGETTQSITVSPLTTTTYSVTVSNGQSSDSDSVTVTVNPLAVAYAGEDETIELGSSITLTAEGGNSFLWSNGATTQQITVSPTETTSYSVTVYIGECSDSDSVQVTVLEPIQASAGEDVEICNGESITLNASGGTTYLWSTGETTASITVNPETTTEYNVQVSNGSQTATASVLVTLNVCETETEQDTVLDSEIQVYPIPARSEINVRVTGYLSDTNIKIYDLRGRELYAEGISNGNTEIMTKTINVSNLPRGVFVLSINKNGTTFSKRIILN
ncbi:T9SS type A sorting domain-containing protein [Hanstruepera marina]|uniref:T9SS type A sorting domain-containing protein n=1 Tax=Hanstruepera marina TaxID=2873265 RepID=UPI001CA68E0C|nr:T9SS type A sorting domain-containing protein [Hanstruepera marina]